MSQQTAMAIEVCDRSVLPFKCVHVVHKHVLIDVDAVFVLRGFIMGYRCGDQVHRARLLGRRFVFAPGGSAVPDEIEVVAVDHHLRIVTNALTPFVALMVFPCAPMSFKFRAQNVPVDDTLRVRIARSGRVARNASTARKDVHIVINAEFINGNFRVFAGAQIGAAMAIANPVTLRSRLRRLDKIERAVTPPPCVPVLCPVALRPLLVFPVPPPSLCGDDLQAHPHPTLGVVRAKRARVA